MVNKAHPQLLFPKRVDYWLAMLGVLALYALLIVPTLRRMGIGWDEAVDLYIARSYLTTGGFFFGLPLDESQTRLPMFSVSLVYRLLGTSDLLIARWSSVVVGGLTLLGITIYGKKIFSREAGLLAAILLAINPFFLSFARLAFTESDIYLACTLTWLLVALSRVQEKPTIGRAAVAGLIFGLSVSAKATIIVILPAIWAGLAYLRISTTKEPTENNHSTSKSVPDLRVLFWSGWAGFVLVVGVLSGILLNISSYPAIYRLVHYGLVCLGWLAALGWVYRYRNHTASYLSIAALMTGLGLLTFAIFPPDHLTNSAIVQSIFSRAGNEMSINLSFVTELAVLHLLTIFLKSTPVLGLCLLAGYLASLVQWRRRELVLPLIIVFSYFTGLLLLPLAQTFYTIPILPVLTLFLANLLVRLWARRRKLALGLVTLLLVFWGVDILQSYPDYHLNGYQWLGARVVYGRSSIGYRSVVYTPSDGVQQVMEWLNTNAKPGEVAELYLAEHHIVEIVAPDPLYQIVDGFDEKLILPPDYIVFHINALLQQGHGNETPQGDIVQYPIDYEVLKKEYRQVFVVRRAFGIEMASIWERM